MKLAKNYLLFYILFVNLIISSLSVKVLKKKETQMPNAYNIYGDIHQHYYRDAHGLLTTHKPENHHPAPQNTDLFKLNILQGNAIDHGQVHYSAAPLRIADKYGNGFNLV